MKENQTESCQNVCWKKLTHDTKNTLHADLIKKALAWCVKNRYVRGH